MFAGRTHEATQEEVHNVMAQHHISTQAHEALMTTVQCAN